MPLADKERGEERAFPHLTRECADLVKRGQNDKEECVEAGASRLESQRLSVYILCLSQC